MPAMLTRVGRKLTAMGWTGSPFDPTVFLELRLIAADFTPVADMPGDGGLTEAVFGGYAAGGFNLNDNGTPVLDGDDYTVLLKDDPFVWDCASSPQTIFGWALYSGDEDAILACERYSVPHVLEVGSRHTLYASIRIGQCG